MIVIGSIAVTATEMGGATVIVIVTATVTVVIIVMVAMAVMVVTVTMVVTTMVVTTMVAITMATELNRTRVIRTACTPAQMMRNVGRAITRRDHITIEMLHRKLFVMASCVAMTRAFVGMVATEAEAIRAVAAEAFWAESLADLKRL